ALEGNSNGSGSNSKDRTGSTSTVHLPSPAPRPPITKAIDVWALGVTLYCLLFARTPFHFEGDNAFTMYVHIANSDWAVDTSETMGYDNVATGGRHPAPDDTSEGATVMRILDGLLQKDANDRLTLDALKSHPWITRDIADPNLWLSVTSPSKNDPVMVNDMETMSAMTNVTSRKGWHQRIKHRISSILHNVRPARPSRSADHTDDEAKVGTSSAPALRAGSRKKRVTGGEKAPEQKSHRVRTKSKSERQLNNFETEKGGRSSKRRPATSRNESAPISPVNPRSKSIDRHMFSQLASNAGTSTSTRYRASETLAGQGPRDDGYDASPESYSPISARANEDRDHHMYSKHHSDERPRNRFSYLSLKHWRSQRNPSHESTPPGASTSTLASSIEPSTPVEVDQHHPRESEDARSVTADRFSPVVFARRASSWGEPGDYEDVLSLNSGGEEDPLDRDAVMLGAGGISNEPVYGHTAPVGFTTAAAAAAASLPLPLRQPQPQRLLIGTQIASTPDPALRDTSAARHTQGVRSQAASPSPLAHIVYGSGQFDDDDSDEDSLGYGNVVNDSQYSGGYTDIPPSSSSIEEEDDDDDDSEESIPIEIRRRRPSVAVTAASLSPPST
ncbi:hypothetical protein HWV62_34297, partial [Athelia sp. TMB]